MLAACGEDLPFVPTPEPTPEQPREVAVSVVTRGTETPVEAAALEVDGTTVLTDADGAATLTALRGATVSASAEGHDAAEGAVPDEGDLVVELRPNVVSGTVTDADGEPVAGVRVFVDGEDRMVETDEDGAYALPDVPEGATVIYKVPGYRLQEMAVTDGVIADVALEPFEARALYAPVGDLRGAGPPGRDARAPRPDRGERDGHRRQGDRRPPLLRHRPRDPPRRSARSARRRSSTSRSCCRR